MSSSASSVARRNGQHAIKLAFCDQKGVMLGPQATVETGLAATQMNILAARAAIHVLTDQIE